MTRWILPLLGSAVVVLGLYVGSYYAMVDREMPRRINGNGFSFEAKYRFGGELASNIFESMNEIDRSIRPGFWFRRIELSELFDE